MSTSRYTGIQVRGEEVAAIDDTIVREERFTLFLNGSRFLDMVASRENLRELGAGFVLCQGLSTSVESVSVEGNEIRVSAPVEESCEREIETTGTVGFICRPPEPVRSGCTITIPDVFAITREIVTDLWRQTGGVHCSVLARDGEILFRASDVGRHNTVDKVIGYAVLHGIDLSSCIVGCTGRQPRDMVIKYANAGVPIVISRAASTDRGIATADELGITLICFSRDERFTVYTHPWRVRGIGPESSSGDAGYRKST
ncbi:MAG: formate dehydrogenase accessory sulfurtransferase FdhD [Methanomicrobiales archaeon]|nr:formate dehydrogenase accessory sulfurtransferase FdhD [Methanomicrobiales archaeon]